MFTKVREEVPVKPSWRYLDEAPPVAPTSWKRKAGAFITYLAMFGAILLIIFWPRSKPLLTIGEFKISPNPFSASEPVAQVKPKLNPPVASNGPVVISKQLPAPVSVPAPIAPPPVTVSLNTSAPALVGPGSPVATNPTTQSDSVSQAKPTQRANGGSKPVKPSDPTTKTPDPATNPTDSSTTSPPPVAATPDPKVPRHSHQPASQGTTGQGTSSDAGPKVPIRHRPGTGSGHKPDPVVTPAPSTVPALPVSSPDSKQTPVATAPASPPASQSKGRVKRRD